MLSVLLLIILIKIFCHNSISLWFSWESQLRELHSPHKEFQMHTNIIFPTVPLNNALEQCIIVQCLLQQVLPVLLRLFFGIRRIGQNAEHLIHHSVVTETLEKKMMPPRITPAEYTVMRNHSVLTYWFVCQKVVLFALHQPAPALLEMSMLFIKRWKTTEALTMLMNG